MSVESYMHKAAKSVLVSWLRKIAEESDDLGFISDEARKWAPFYWRVNRGRPTYGVWEEWPVFGQYGTSLVWDESYWPLHLQHGIPINGRLPDGLLQYSEDGPDISPDVSKLLNDRPPTYDECLRLGSAPEVIFDVAIQHKGCMVIAFEVVHKNDISEKKLNSLQAIHRRHGCQVYRVPAAWILGQTGFPEKFVGDRIV